MRFKAKASINAFRLRNSVLIPYFSSQERLLTIGILNKIFLELVQKVTLKDSNLFLDKEFFQWERNASIKNVALVLKHTTHLFKNAKMIISIPEMNKQIRISMLYAVQNIHPSLLNLETIPAAINYLGEEYVEKMFKAGKDENENIYLKRMNLCTTKNDNELIGKFNHDDTKEDIEKKMTVLQTDLHMLQFNQEVIQEQYRSQYSHLSNEQVVQAAKAYIQNQRQQILKKIKDDRTAKASKNAAEPDNSAFLLPELPMNPKLVHEQYRRQYPQLKDEQIIEATKGYLQNQKRVYHRYIESQKANSFF